MRAFLEEVRNVFFWLAGDLLLFMIVVLIMSVIMNVAGVAL
jgi:hypothetical protein